MLLNQIIPGFYIFLIKFLKNVFLQLFLVLLLDVLQHKAVACQGRALECHVINFYFKF